MQQTPNPLAQLPSLVPPLLEHSSLFHILSIMVVDIFGLKVHMTKHLRSETCTISGSSSTDIIRESYNVENREN